MATKAAQERLRSMDFDRDAARDAIRGIAVPRALGRELMRLCVVRGIRYHDAFAALPELGELRRLVPEFARAINARTIMSNSIPEMSAAAEDIPYCIWHPTTATQETYRELACRYPCMIYQVARACAVAGYTDLYLEIEAQILPDVSIAEEARACGSEAIFRAIMSKPVQYRAMDDYARSINTQNPRPSLLNGDTAIRPMLDIKQEIGNPHGHESNKWNTVVGQDGDSSDDDDFSAEDAFDDLFPDKGITSNLFNITEDMNVGEASTPEEILDSILPSLDGLLTKPLPIVLPQGNKDILIREAAYNGNIDRYDRLRRPVMDTNEAACLVRGIYHCPFFAIWWRTQPLPLGSYGLWIAQAINARMIMSNDLSQLGSAPPRPHLPYLIWYPAIAQSATYMELTRRLPDMRPAVLRAAVFAKDRTLFDTMLDEFDVEPDPYVLAEAKSTDEDAQQSYFTRRLLARAEELGLQIESVSSDYAIQKWGAHLWKRNSVYSGAYNGPPRVGNWLYHFPDVVGGTEEPGIYNGVWADASAAELLASIPAEWRPKQDQSMALDYKTWPPSLGTRN
ncbi:hypothetical protein HIM_10731 [Hirsutella minnesotensis 3608]|uniref:Uncharacterized protein n=1 Tax=Hirsutella minnesotensis 3608 TaxID=1043627 RepID=A0A0F7ZFX0_9HYPO|nr:hypothetical protein HIM_10731 [Hirsutella minnesotensis 3608]